MKKNDFWLTDDGALYISAWRRDGLNYAEIAEKIGVSVSTLGNWKKKYPKIADALKNKREKVDILVENAILKKALGFSTTEVKTVTKANGAEEVTTVQKEVPPDVSAASVWLKNRRPDKWRDKPTEDKSGMYNKLDEILGGIDAQVD